MDRKSKAFPQLSIQQHAGPEINILKVNKAPCKSTDRQQVYQKRAHFAVPAQPTNAYLQYFSLLILRDGTLKPICPSDLSMVLADPFRNGYPIQGGKSTLSCLLESGLIATYNSWLIVWATAVNSGPKE